MKPTERVFRELKCLSQRNSIILNYPEHKVRKNRVNLHYYHADWQDNVICNLGDYLSEVIVLWMCKEKGMQFDKNLNETRNLYAIGSILQMGYQDATIWGTGFAFEMSGIRAYLHKIRKLDIRCVRGPKTSETLRRMGFERCECYGDPGVLMPLLYQPKKVKDTDYLIIPHFSVEEDAKRKYGKDYILSMNTKDYQGVIDRICATKKVITSSLHGIILAESYGVPAVFYQDRQTKFNYKYMDWYESTWRNEVKPVSTVEEGFKVSIKPPDETKIREMQEMLMDKFPVDIFK